MRSALRRILRSVLAVAAGWMLTGGSLAADEFRADVVVYGGTSAGVAAAVQAARMKKSVLLLEPGTRFGGLTSGGLGWTDSGNKAVIGGISREFYQRIKKHYDQPTAWRYQKAEQYSRYRAQEDAMWAFEPHVAARLMKQMLSEHAGIHILQDRLDRSQNPRFGGRRITAIKTEKGHWCGGKMFIDATYEGDLMAAAKVSYFVGREANSQYDETLNGVQKRQNTHKHRFVVDVDPYRVPGKPESGLLPGVHGDDPGEEGAGDKRVQAYCFRMCMSNVPENRVPFAKPENYDPLRYELLLRNFEAGDLRLPLKPDMMPNGKTDTNNNCAFSTDNLAKNYAYPEGSYADREAIVKEHLHYQQGLMWTLAHHPRVPESIRRQMSVWGLAKDEFTDSDHWPRQLYIREARRMVSDYVMTEHDCRRQRVVEDSVGLGSYNMDSHNVQRYVTPEGFVQNEGDVQVSPGGAYLISYRSLVPRKGEAENLLVPVCLSASHIAYGSIRMEPVFMILGQSASTAASLCIDRKLAVQDLPYEALQERLRADNQVLDLPAGSKPKITIASSRLPGQVLDDAEAKFTGDWGSSSSAGPFVDAGYRHDGNEGKGKKSAVFEQPLKSFVYEVRVSYSAHANRATNVPIEIQHAEGRTRKQINQRRPPADKQGFVSLGHYRFREDQPARITISTENTDGYVIVDAVQFLLPP